MWLDLSACESAVRMARSASEKVQETDHAVPSPVGRERGRVRGILFELHFLSDTCSCTDP
jgi:hypothetical protein